MTSLFGGEGGVSQKMTKGDRGEGGGSRSEKDDVTLHSGGRGGVSQKMTKGDRGGGGVSGLFSNPKMTSFLDGP